MTFEKQTLVLAVSLLLSACSLDSNHPVFLSTDGDYIGQKIKITGVIEKGKPAEGYLQVHPSSDGSYFISTDLPPKFDDRYVFRAIKKVSDGIIYAAQVNTASRPMEDGTQTKPGYEIYPVKISSSGEITIYEFLHDDITAQLVRKRKVNAGVKPSSLRFEGEFNRENIQCLVQDLIKKEHYKVMGVKSTPPVFLVGYIPPKDIGVSGCD